MNLKVHVHVMFADIGPHGSGVSDDSSGREEGLEVSTTVSQPPYGHSYLYELQALMLV